ncbi:MAG: hypothetical protein A2Z26_04925 [Deltaproteobacteria bacterium RBG_16_66_15]|nr:MAG: hypothetical protein A2Z26_04925 [Deltaproteobacteria bacterium RBG_16_66_15]
MPGKEEESMGSIGKKIFTVAVGLALAAGIPHPATTSAHAGSGCDGCECPRGEKSGRGHGGECDCGGHRGKHEGMHGRDGKHAHGKHMAGGPPMKEGMARHMEEMRATIANLRALEAKMESLKSKDDAAAFRAASLEHSKLLTDLQESHLKHMEGMMGGGK